MKLREKYRIPVIILSAKTEESDKVSGLVLGADVTLNSVVLERKDGGDIYTSTYYDCGGSIDYIISTGNEYVSSTISVNTPWSNCVRTVTLPRSVNLIALDNKLLPICIILSLSPITTASPALSTFSKRFFLPPAWQYW